MTGQYCPGASHGGGLHDGRLSSRFGNTLIAAGISLAVAGCATTQQAQNAIESRFIGQSSDAFFARYGMPLSSYPLNNSTLYRWRGGETSVHVPAEYRKTDPAAAGVGAGKTRSTTQVSNPNPNTTITETTTTSFSIGGLLSPQALLSPARTVPIFCEAQVTVDAKGVIVGMRIMQDTRGFGLSLSRCAEVFDVK